MIKRFKDTANVWTQCGLFLMKQSRPDAARKILEKSLKAVNKKQRKNQCIYSYNLYKLLLEGLDYIVHFVLINMYIIYKVKWLDILQ